MSSDENSPPNAATHEEQAREAARDARLRYVHGTMPGIRRTRTHSGSFRYVGPDGKVVTDEKTLKRIAALGIPPAYNDVWICPIPNGHLQATGRDAKGRKQYRYHERWREVRDVTKYERMLAFGAALPRIRDRVAQDLALPGLPREKVLATIVRLLETTRIRVGNEEYAQANDSFGLTTLRNRHVDIEKSTLHFHFRGKSGKEHFIDLKDRRIARIVARLQDLEGQELFQFVDDAGVPHRITSGDVNAYLRSVAGEEFTAKDFRTWAGTVLCALCLAVIEHDDAPTKTQLTHDIAEAVRAVSERLGNTPAVCRKCYIHPHLFTAYEDGSLTADLKLPDAAEGVPLPVPETGLSPAEKAVLSFLKERSG